MSVTWATQNFTPPSLETIAPPQGSLAALIVCSTLLVLQIIAGFIGNSAICLIVYKSKILKTPVNALLVNLAIADIATTAVTSPVFLSTLFISTSFNGTNYIFPDYAYLLGGVVYVSYVICGTVQLVTLICISFERLQAIAKPFEKVQRVKRVKISIIASWFLGLINCFVAVGAFHDDLEIQHFRAPPLTLPLYSKFIAFVFIPFSFLSVFLILLLYAMILYMVKKHVETSSKRLGKNNKVSPKPEVTMVEEVFDKSKSACASAVDVTKGRKASSIGNSSVPGDNIKAYNMTLMPNTNEDAAFVDWQKESASTQGSDISEDVLESIRKLHLVPLKWKGNDDKMKLLNKRPDMENLEVPMSSKWRSIMQRRSTGFLSGPPVRHVSVPDDNCPQRPAPVSRRISYHSGVNVTTQTLSATNSSNLAPLDANQQTANTSQVSGRVDGRVNGPSDVINRVNEKKSEASDSRKEARLVNECDVKETPGRGERSKTPNDSCQSDGFHVKLSPGENGKTRKTDKQHITEITEATEKTTPAILVSRQTEQSLSCSNHFHGNKQSGGKAEQPKKCTPRELVKRLSPDTLYVKSAIKDNSSRVEDEKSAGDNVSQLENPASMAPTEDFKSGLSEPVIEICDMNGGKLKVVATQSEVVGSICVMNTANKERGKRKVEAKTAKTSAIVISAFLVCWLPFPSVVLAGWASRLQKSNNFETTSIDEWFVVALSLATLGAAINPIAYGVFNKQFRNEITKFIRNLKKRWKKKK